MELWLSGKGRSPQRADKIHEGRRPPLDPLFAPNLPPIGQLPARPGDGSCRAKACTRPAPHRSGRSLHPPARSSPAPGPPGRRQPGWSARPAPARGRPPRLHSRGAQGGADQPAVGGLCTTLAAAPALPRRSQPASRDPKHCQQGCGWKHALADPRASHCRLPGPWIFPALPRPLCTSHTCRQLDHPHLHLT